MFNFTNCLVKFGCTYQRFCFHWNCFCLEMFQNMLFQLEITLFTSDKFKTVPAECLRPKFRQIKKSYKSFVDNNFIFKP